MKIGSSLIAPSLTIIFKGKGAFDDCGNYRPISITSQVSKIVEKVVLFQLKEYISCHSLITHTQSAFINNLSTTTAVQRVIFEIIQGFNENEITSMCFIDLQKCFDTIDHSVLLKKT